MCSGTAETSTTREGVERGCGRVNHRGALLGPEGSGRILADSGLVSSGRFSTDLFRWGVWLGPALTKLLVVIL